ncbi:hypothetical protein OCU04_003980 [Sclerotinia nivalis]|uniref:Uncharacterized protein n=1 Tax=Sclerotinia nivalis TaxID=352851 RepID=A0A9X0AT12_9HELO|nr:hypothetical protein OCU04_003980 [Sclerotinia nivalis]
MNYVDSANISQHHKYNAEGHSPSLIRNSALWQVTEEQEIECSDDLKISPQLSKVQLDLEVHNRQWKIFLPQPKWHELTMYVGLVGEIYDMTEAFSGQYSVM